MSGAVALLLALLWPLIFHWPLWLALILVQAYALWVGLGEQRWMPLLLLGIGYGLSVARPLLSIIGR